MNSSAISWISQSGLENSILMDQYCDFMDSFDGDLDAALIGQEFQNYLSPENFNSTCSSTLIDAHTHHSNSINSWYTSAGLILEQVQQQTPDNVYSPTPTTFSALQNLIIPADHQASSRPTILTFGTQNPTENLQKVQEQVKPMPPLNPEEEVVVPEVLGSRGSHNVITCEEAKPVKVQTTKKRSRVRPPSQTYDHIIAERRRREQLSQLFVALSAIVPGLKKMDKSSVLEDAIKYLKHLQDRVKNLEELAEKQAMESVVLVKKSQIVVEDEGSSDEQSGCFEEQPLPEIEACVCESHILLRVHCEKQKGVLVNLLCKVESLNMIVVNTNATPFGNVSLDITIIAELEKEFNLTGKEVATAIREALDQAAAIDN